MAGQMIETWTVYVTLGATTVSFTFFSEADMRAFGELARKAEGVIGISYGEAATRFTSAAQ